MTIKFIKKHISNIEIFLLFLIYFSINSLFIYKYGLRQDFITVTFLLIAFPLLICSLKYLISKLNLRQLKASYITVTVLFFIFTLVLNFLVDGNNLNVDRWSAMEVSIASIFDNKYPYSAIDHLNGRSSNLPGLIVLGIPFYALGNIGLLQSFSFLLFAYTIYKTIHSASAKLFGLIMLTLSISFWWEVYVKSDLMSNFIIITSFIVLWYHHFKNEIFKKPSLLGTLTSLLFFTRLVSVIPLTLLVFKGFLKATNAKKMAFISAAILTLGLLSFVVLKDLPSYDVFREYNPFLLQNRQLPLLLSVIFISLPFYYATKIISLKLLMRYSLIFVLIPVISALLLVMNRYSFLDIINNSAFDLSYLNMSAPFLIYYMTMRFDKKP